LQGTSLENLLSPALKTILEYDYYYADFASFPTTFRARQVTHGYQIFYLSSCGRKESGGSATSFYESN
jgi:hypothetical protein